MTQLNLLPDVKLQYLRAQRQRRLVFTISVLVSAVSLIILLMLLSADGLQHKHLNDLNNDISTETQQLKHKPQINKMLTVQNQLGSLTQLHSQEPAAARLFVYLNQVTPSSVAITDFNIDFTKQTITLTGTSGTLANVNTYVDTLKKANFTVGNSKTSQPAFSNVVLSSFSLNTGSQQPGQAANYTVTLDYNPEIFFITENITLSVPTETATRQNGGQASDLFQAAPPSQQSNGSNGGTQ
ncbi:MAG TPA: PilN domain-containing protein [Candidatus Saccharimonadales bacterium]|nr:PilN domain-containing protein [Candidatus Saccharimonadales bacterium]